MLDEDERKRKKMDKKKANSHKSTKTMSRVGQLFGIAFEREPLFQIFFVLELLLLLDTSPFGSTHEMNLYSTWGMRLRRTDSVPPPSTSRRLKTFRGLVLRPL